jgi:hypothetical protein
LAKGVALRRKRSAEEIADVLTQYNLPVQQRVAIRAMMSTSNKAEALRLLKKHGVEITRMTLDRWLKRTDFKEALFRAECAVARNVSKENVLRKTEALLEEAMTPKPILYKGEHTGFEEVELGTATRLVELQGKAAGLFNDEHQTKVAVMVDIDFSGRKDAPVDAQVIDGELVEPELKKDDSWLG